MDFVLEANAILDWGGGGGVDYNDQEIDRGIR